MVGWFDRSIIRLKRIFLVSSADVEFANGGFDLSEVAVSRDELQAESDGDCGDNQVYCGDGGSSL